MDGIERINEMAKGQKDFVLLEIVKHLTSKVDMNEKYLNKEKTLQGMALYIQRELLKNFCEKMNVKEPSELAQNVKYNNNNARCIAVGMSEQQTFELAENYFNKSNEELGIKPEVIKKNRENKTKEDEFGSIFGAEETIVEEKKNEIEQISLFTGGAVCM